MKLSFSVMGCAIAIAAYAPTVVAVNDEPLKDKWAPSEWGADD